jgi:hypothetical protein
MAYLFNNGSSTLMLTVASSGALMYALKELLKAAGWEVQASSDGINVSNTAGNANDQITSAVEMNTSNAWFVIKQPDQRGGHGPGGRQFIFRRGASDANWLVAYVPRQAESAGGGAQAPTANGTTAAIPTFTATHALVGTLPDTAGAFFSAASSRRWQLCAQDADPFGFYMIGWTTGAPGTGGVTTPGALLFDPLEPGTFDEDDQDPYAIYCVGTAASGTPFTFNGSFAASPSAPNTTLGLTPGAYYRKGLTREGFYPHTALPLMDTVRSAYGLNPIDPKREQSLPVIYGRRCISGTTTTERTQIKGQSMFARWKAAGVPTGSRFSRGGISNNRIVVGDVTLPWDPSVNPSWS